MRLAHPIFNGTGRTFRAIGDAADARPGDVLELRDFEALASEGAERAAGWSYVPYELANGLKGRMLQAFGIHRERPEDHLPSPFVFDPRLAGAWAIWIAVPRLEFAPRIMASGPDAALEGGLPTLVTPFCGTRHGSPMGPVGCERWIWWTDAALDGRRIELRHPHGQFGLWPYGLVNACASAIRFVKLDPDAAPSGRDPALKDCGFMLDGFSHYLNARPDAPYDARFVEAYKDCGVRRIYWQTPSTCTAAWASALTDLPGDRLDEAAWSGLRVCDRRIHDHLRASVDGGWEGMRTVSEACRAEGMEFHLSFRMNLEWRMNERDRAFAGFINGRWWFEHRDLLRADGCFLDYAKPEARRFICDLAREAAGKYPLDGFCMDLTRWPPVFSEDGVLPVFLAEMRAALDAAPDGKRIKLGFTAVEGYHARAGLEAQRIDLRAALATGVVDYCGVQAPRHDAHSALAREFRAEYLAVVEQESIDHPNGLWEDPLWQDPVLRDGDPVPGEEFWDAPRVNGTLSPAEYDIAIARACAEGADGFIVTNNDYARQVGAAADPSGTLERVRSGAAWGQLDGHGIRIDPA
jgi:hypothetical protein